MLGFQTHEKPLALASAISYFVFRSRDIQRSPANGIKTWEYLQTSIQNATTGKGSESLHWYIANLSNLLIVPALRPTYWRELFNQEQVILRATRQDDGSMGEIIQLEKDQALAWNSWEDIVAQWYLESGITQKQVIRECQGNPYSVTLLCRLKHEEIKQLEKDKKALNVTEDEEFIDV